MPDLEKGLHASKQEYRVIIIGAGIGGVAAAIGFAQEGHKVVLLERMPEFPSVSYGRESKAILRTE
jgi:2-polyprenyl-6-methoxyphenol hydroxylase-like FAD-dependent oxidoreductase